MKIVVISVRAGCKVVNAKGAELSMASLMIPPPRAVSDDAISTPKISRSFFMAIKKPLIVKAVIPMISANIKYSGINLFIFDSET